MVFAVFVSLGQASSSIVGLLILLLVWLFSKQSPALKAWMMVKRLRIFFLSIFIMFLWFTPGQLIWPALDEWSPTYDGLIQALQRIFALILLVLGVETLLRLTDRPSLLVGLYYLATPFKWLGINQSRFIIRVLLTLEAASGNSIPRPGKQKLDKENSNDKFDIRKVGVYLNNVSEQLAEKFNVAANLEIETKEVEFEINPLPSWIQWLIPIIIAALFLITSISLENVFI